MDANLGNLLGTVAAVAFANLWSRRTRRPTSIVLTPSIVLLVSGSVGFRGLAAIAEGEVAFGGTTVLADVRGCRDHRRRTTRRQHPRSAEGHALSEKLKELVTVGALSSYDKALDTIGIEK